MLIKDLKNCKEIVAGDKTLLREIIHARETENKIGYSIALAIIMPHEKSIPHKLKSSEVYYILEGKGKMFTDGESANIRKDQAIYIPPNSEQWIINTGRNRN